MWQGRSPLLPFMVEDDIDRLNEAVTEHRKAFNNQIAGGRSD